MIVTIAGTIVLAPSLSMGHSITGLIQHFTSGLVQDSARLHIPNIQELVLKNSQKRQGLYLHLSSEEMEVWEVKEGCLRSQSWSLSQPGLELACRLRSLSRVEPVPLLLHWVAYMNTLWGRPNNVSLASKFVTKGAQMLPAHLLTPCFYIYFIVYALSFPTFPPFVPIVSFCWMFSLGSVLKFRVMESNKIKIPMEKSTS